MKKELEVYLEGNILESSYGERLDAAISALFPQYSRSNIQKWIKNHSVKVSGVTVEKVNGRVKGGEAVEISAVLETKAPWQAEAIDLDIVYEDESLIIVNKTHNMVVHPAAGNNEGTLVNALLFHFPELNALPRAGIIHRLDKDTTGLLVIARNLSAHNHLIEQQQARAFTREYICLVEGELTAGGTIEANIGRHPQNRIKMAVVEDGKYAVTHYRRVARMGPYSLLRVRLETGRTHQIRVHMAHLGHPLVGDPLYGDASKRPQGVSDSWVDTIKQFRRQALHARLLGIKHPVSENPLEWTQETPDDFQSLLDDMIETFGVEHY
ncbi:MAG: 23S rRNA pseudouridine(1911/1915/1917) synthase RluD [Pseudomonadota bacterium]